MFSGGLGETSAELRSRTVEGLGFLGLDLPDGATAGDGREGVLTPPGVRPAVVVVHAREDHVVAADVRAMLA